MGMSALAFDVAWAAAGLDDKPPALAMPSPGATLEERRAVEEQAWAELHHSGLAHQGLLRGDTRDALTLLGGASRELYGFFGPAQVKPGSVIAAASGEDAVFARLHEDTVELEPIRATNLAPSVAEGLPALGKGQGPALSAPLSAVLGNAGSGDSILQRSDGGGGGNAAGARIRRVLERPRLGGGQFYAATRDRWGKRTRHPAFIAILDTADGRYLIEQRAANTQEPWLILSPASTDVIIRAFDGLLTGH
jgi:hypothetical protein